MMLNLVGKKIGMSRIYQEDGAAIPFTMVKLYDNCVIDLIVNDNKDFDNLILGSQKVENNKKVSKPIAGVFNKKKVPLHRKIYGCKVKKDSGYKTGDVITTDSVLKEGDVVDVAGTSSGKGFAGAMKRHGFGGLEASHGISVSHRSHGSTGQCQDPGKVFKGKKMAGHMGADSITVKNLQILGVDTKNNTISIQGAIPGRSGNDVVLKIANYSKPAPKVDNADKDNTVAEVATDNTTNKEAVAKTTANNEKDN